MRYQTPLQLRENRHACMSRKAVRTGPATTPVTVHDTSELNALRGTLSKIPASIPAYDRHDWKHWTDADGDCQDSRNEVLVTQSRATIVYRTDRRCRVSAGEWLTPYTNSVRHRPRQT